jgi:3-dehydroquinate synthase
MNRRLFKPLLLVSIVLILPIALLAVRGESFVTQLRAWQSSPPAPWTLAALVVGILAADIVLPVPSGPVSTLAGSHLGVVLGTAASTLGMTLGAAIAFAVARRFGVDEQDGDLDVGDVSEAANQHGPWMLVLTRPLPIIAEAAVLLAGALRMPWRNFLPPVVASNLAISATYATFGRHAAAHGWLPLAVCASVAAPLAVAVYFRRRLSRG